MGIMGEYIEVYDTLHISCRNEHSIPDSERPHDIATSGISVRVSMTQAEL